MGCGWGSFAAAVVGVVIFILNAVGIEAPQAEALRGPTGGLRKTRDTGGNGDG
jgi:hypothetical protein